MRLSLQNLPHVTIRINMRTLLLAIIILITALMSGILGNPFVILSVGFLTLLFPVSVFIRRTKIWDYFTLVPVKAKTMAVGSIAALLISFFLWSIRTVISLELITVSKVLLLDTIALFTLVAMIIAVQGLHLVQNYLHKKIVADQTNDIKFIFYSSGLLTILFLTGLDARVLLIHTVAYIIYSLLLDLFIEDKKANLIWLILWTIILGSFLSMAIVQGTNAISSSPVSLLNAFSIFSLVFIFSGVIYIVFGLLNKSNKLLPAEWEFNFSHALLLRNRIQLSILVTLVFSFIAIGLVSLYHLNAVSNASAYDLTSKFTQALLNTYVFLFLIGFSISFSLSQYIRNPLIELGRTLKEVKLNHTNKKIEWQGSDEIGNLIKEYNQMIEKLEVNASLLAQVERDNAWREMAKQVAHEIKNPLTPMKLSLQHLQRTINQKSEHTEAMTIRMCETLMNQVDNLQQIADEFSNFGSLPQSDNQRILLNEVVERIHDLFRNRQDMDIHLIEPIDDIGVYADKNQLIRVLNNIVKNSIQAIPEDIKGYIELKLWKEDNKAIITVKDNGIGISEDQKGEIFKPRFTTKSSGSGLGLAIAANMIDSMGGTIRFESEPGKGTEFFIELPLIRSVYPRSYARVSLEEELS